MLAFIAYFFFIFCSHSGTPLAVKMQNLSCYGLSMKWMHWRQRKDNKQMLQTFYIYLKTTAVFVVADWSLQSCHCILLNEGAGGKCCLMKAWWGYREVKECHWMSSACRNHRGTPLWIWSRYKGFYFCSTIVIFVWFSTKNSRTASSFCEVCSFSDSELAVGVVFLFRE